jgi:hypothetical protein
MMPAIDSRCDARRKRARVAVFITAGTITVSSALDGTRLVGWRWLPSGVWLDPHHRLLRCLHEFRRRPEWPPRDERAGRSAGPQGGAPAAWAGHGVADDARARWPTVAGGSAERAVGDNGRPARRGGPQLPAVRPPGGDSDVGARVPAAGTAGPAPSWMTACGCIECPA